jgi:TorA maturation chaperone TorD
VIAAEAQQASPPGLTEEDRARVDLYRLLGRLLATPPAREMLGLLAQADAGSGPLAAIWGDLKEAAQATSEEDLADEYHRLFIGLGRGEVVPYASFYLTGFLMERPLAELRGRLKAFGIERQEGVSEPEDHAAALCEVMGLLIEENRLPLEDAREFFGAFVGAWMGRFFQDLSAAESSRFYRPVAMLGQRLMEIEQAYYSMPD